MKRLVKGKKTSNFVLKPVFPSFLFSLRFVILPVMEIVGTVDKNQLLEF